MNTLSTLGAKRGGEREGDEGDGGRGTELGERVWGAQCPVFSVIYISVVTAAVRLARWPAVLNLELNSASD